MKVIIISLILIKELFSLQLKKQQSHGITNSVSSSTICSKGEYLYNNSQCVDKCPKGYYADNILHKCTTTNNAVSILAYTKKSCKGVCGQSFPECTRGHNPDGEHTPISGHYYDVPPAMLRTSCKCLNIDNMC